MLFIFAIRTELSYLFILEIMNITAFQYKYVFVDLLKLVLSLENLPFYHYVNYFYCV